jgi:hypothetical protein
MIINDQAFSPSYDLALSREQVFSLLSLPVCRRSSLLTRESGGGAKSYDADKAWSSINHNTLQCFGSVIIFDPDPDLAFYAKYRSGSNPDPGFD